MVLHHMPPWPQSFSTQSTPTTGVLRLGTGLKDRGGGGVKGPFRMMYFSRPPFSVVEGLGCGRLARGRRRIEPRRRRRSERWRRRRRRRSNRKPLRWPTGGAPAALAAGRCVSWRSFALVFRGHCGWGVAWGMAGPQAVNRGGVGASPRHPRRGGAGGGGRTGGGGPEGAGGTASGADGPGGGPAQRPHCPWSWGWGWAAGGLTNKLIHLTCLPGTGCSVCRGQSCLFPCLFSGCCQRKWRRC